MNKLSEEPR